MTFPAAWRHVATGVRGQGVQAAGGRDDDTDHRRRVRSAEGHQCLHQLDAEHGRGNGRLRGPRRRGDGRHADPAGAAAGRRPQALLRTHDAGAKSAHRY